MAEFLADFPTVARLRLVVNEIATDASANTSTVAWRATLEQRTSSAWRAYHDCVWSLTVDGAQVAGAPNADYNLTAGTVIVLHEGTATIAHDAAGEKSIGVTLTYDGKDPIGAATAAGSMTLTPLYLPPAPAAAVAATRVSDQQVNLSWSNPTEPRRPYSWTNIDRWDNVTGQWVGLQSVAATALTDTAVQSDREYRYALHQIGAGGTAQTSYSGSVWTTPLPPDSVTATKTATGGIAISWADRSTIETGFEIQDSPDGGTWVSVASVPAGSTSYTHTSPSTSQTHRYRVRALGTGGLTSPWSPTSNTVQLLAAPSAPTLIHPVSGTYFDAAKPRTFSWRHNPVDTTPQQAWELRYREDGATAWTTLSGTTESQTTLGSGTLANGRTYEWQARTRGQHPDWSPWAAATCRTSATPTVTISNPAAGQPWLSNRVPISWAYSDAEATAQARARVRMWTGAGQLWVAELTGTATSYEHPSFRADNLATYSVGVQVQDGHGLWSTEAVQSFRAEFREPARPEPQADWVDDSGAVVIRIANPAPTASQETTARNEVWRCTDRTALDVLARIRAGSPTDPDHAQLVAEFDHLFRATMELVASDVPPGGTINDPIPSLTSTAYRVLAISDLGTSKWSYTIRVDAPEADWWWLNAGSGLALVCRWRGNPVSAQAVGRDKTLHRFAGRQRPVQFTGVHRSKTFNLGGVGEPSAPHSTIEALEAVLDADGLVFLRDPYGRREWVSLSEAQTEDLPWVEYHWSWTGTATRVDKP